MKLRVILGDQLSENISSLAGYDPETDRVILMEVMDEACYVPHHKQKIAFIFSAMRHFSDLLKDKGYKVDYIKLSDKRSRNSFTKTLEAYINAKPVTSIIVTHPGEWRVLQEIKKWKKRLNVEVEIREDTRFLCSIDQFKTWAKGKKVLRMENFYRMMRQKHDLLMKGKKPAGGTWNLDKENRKPLPQGVNLPKFPSFTKDSITQDVLKLVGNRFSDHFGDLESFNFATTRKQALYAFSHFIKHSLPLFGPYQDAMKEGEHVLFHSVVSQYLNCGLLEPLELCQKVEEAYDKKEVSLQSAEGYIRQILGWREFVRGIYWLLMPKYAQGNSLGAKRDLPSFYWSGKTKMNCMRHVIEQTEQTATSHHIQRLMVTGNFALLAGLDPEQVCAWYLAVYADAYEWVELPNTLGMALHADNGVVGSKPYAASGSYINRMSDFCKRCHYNVKEKTTENACPFNFLYWDFMARHEKYLAKNPRMKFALNHLQRMDKDDLKTVRVKAKKFLTNMD